MEKNPTVQIDDADLIAAPRRAVLRKPALFALGLLTVGGAGALTLRSRPAPPPLVVTAPAAAPAPSPAITPPPASAPSPAPAAPDPVIARAIESPHDEPEAARPLNAADHLKLARKLEREAERNRRLAAAEYRRQAAQHRRVAAVERRKSVAEARAATRLQRLAMRSLRRGA